MDRKKNKIIVLIDYPFNKRDYDRFGIELLRNNGLEVEIWDITSCLHKKYKDQLIEENPANFTDLRIFEEKSDIINAISLLDARCIINCFVEYSIRTFFIFRTISKYQINYCVFGMVPFPSPEPIQNSFTGRVVSVLKKGNALKFNQIIQHVLNKILLDYYFVFGIAPASIILLAGETSPGKPSYPVNKSTSRLWTHMPDYDIYLQQKNEPEDPCKIEGVFLDQYLPRHPDFLHMGIDFPFSPSDYYPKICNFFEILEKNMNSRIVIAAHPRSDYDNSPDYFGGRTIIKGQTSRIVKKSSFVVTHTSTSINFAVLYHKPIVFITTDNLQKMVSGKNILGLYIQAIARELGKNPINIDHVSEFNWECEMAIDEEAYLRYKNLYIKRKGTPENPLWEIYCSHLQQKIFSDNP